MPLALTLEWLAHGCPPRKRRPNLPRLRQPAVLHGIVLDGNAPPHFTHLAGKAVKKDGYYRTLVELRGTRGDGRDRLFARAEIVLATDLPAAPPRRPVAARPLHSFTPEEIYSRVLFHGPDMQCIEEVEA